jgi:hypothetical protein
VHQDAAGVSVSGETDLGAGTEMDAILTTAASPAGAQDGAILVGSTSGARSQPPYPPVKASPNALNQFAILLGTAVTDTCHLQPPCGPWPAGVYHLLIDIHTQTDIVGGPSSLDDKRYLTHMHGFRGGAGLELWLPVTLGPITLHVDRDGQQATGAAQP